MSLANFATKCNPYLWLMKVWIHLFECSNTLTRGGTYHISWNVLTRVNVLTLYHYENWHISWYGSLARTIFHDMVRSSGLYFMIWFARADYIFCYCCIIAILLEYCSNITGILLRYYIIFQKLKWHIEEFENRYVDFHNGILLNTQTFLFMH